MGFPLDLTQLMATELGLAVDADGFAAHMAGQVRDTPPTV
jgi:alanyl-tRNA synthetase